MRISGCHVRAGQLTRAATHQATEELSRFPRTLFPSHGLAGHAAELSLHFPAFALRAHGALGLPLQLEIAVQPSRIEMRLRTGYLDRSTTSVDEALAMIERSCAEKKPLSVGLLGVGQLMLVGLQTGGSALMRTQAVSLLSDMMERIRANPAARDAYDCATYSPAPTERGCAPSGVPAVQCTAHELAEDDLARWQQHARQTLPLRSLGPCDANVRYFADAVEPGVARYEVELTWYERGQDSPASLVGVLLVTTDVRA